MNAPDHVFSSASPNCISCFFVPSPSNDHGAAAEYFDKLHSARVIEAAGNTRYPSLRTKPARPLLGSEDIVSSRKDASRPRPAREALRNIPAIPFAIGSTHCVRTTLRFAFEMIRQERYGCMKDQLRRCRSQRYVPWHLGFVDRPTS